MAEADDVDPVTLSELTRAAGRPARGALAVNGYTTYEHLTTATEKELLQLHGVGPKAIRILGEELAARGLSFRRED